MDYSAQLHYPGKLTKKSQRERSTNKQIKKEADDVEKLIKRIIRKMAWTAKKKTIIQVLTPRCRLDGMPEYGRFISRDIEQIILQAHSNIKELTPHFSDFYKQFGKEEMTLFRKTWCTYDYAAAEHLVEGGKYQRKHTLSDADELCDMRWSIIES